MFDLAEYVFEPPAPPHFSLLVSRGFPSAGHLAVAERRAFVSPLSPKPIAADGGTMPASKIGVLAGASLIRDPMNAPSARP